jgi:hypothetical protein
MTGIIAMDVRRHRFSVEGKKLKILQTYIEMEPQRKKLGGETSETAHRGRNTPQGLRALFPANMSAFLKIDICRNCRRSLPWEWVPAVLLNGKTLPGTGVWRTQLSEGQCPSCTAAQEIQRQERERAAARRTKLVARLGGEKPYHEFTFERFEVTPDNELAYHSCRRFDPMVKSLYL